MTTKIITLGQLPENKKFPIGVTLPSKLARDLEIEKVIYLDEGDNEIAAEIADFLSNHAEYKKWIAGYTEETAPVSEKKSRPVKATGEKADFLNMPTALGDVSKDSGE